MERKLGADNALVKLYEASMEGSVATLKSLIQEDPLILSKISLTTFGETPLHVAALLGHKDFTRELLSHKPKGPRFASQLDLLRRSPLHLASAEGHAEIVEALLEVNVDMCLVPDEDGKIPLHYATMRGHVEVIKLLIGAREESVFVLLAEGVTVLHLAVQYNHLEALKLLVESVSFQNDDFLNMKESDGGNTILHLAVMLKQIEAVKYLLSFAGVKAGAGTINHRGLTAFDMVHHLPRDFKCLKIQSIFADMDVGEQKNQKDNNSLDLSPPMPTTESAHDVREFYQESEKSKNRWWRKWLGYLKLNRDDWLEESRGSMMVVATVISTITFQTAVTPPGGVWPENVSKLEGFDCALGNMCYAGTSVLARALPNTTYFHFMTLNTISFLASVSVILLLISGFPLKNKFCMWVLTIAMCITLTFLSLTFLMALLLVAPLYMVMLAAKMLELWLGLLIMLSIFYTIRFGMWIVKKWRQGRRFVKRQVTLMRSGKDSKLSLLSTGSGDHHVHQVPLDIN